MADKDKKAVSVQQVTRHIRALLISAPNGLNIVEIQNDYQNIIGKPFPYRELGFKEPLGLLKAMPDVVQPTWVRGELILRGIADETSEHIAKLVSKQRKASKKRATHIIRKKPVPSPYVPHYIRTKIQELMTYYPNGILGSKFLDAFSRHFLTSIDFRRLGFLLLLDLLKSIPEIVTVENIKLGGYRVYGKSSQSDDNRSKPSSTAVSSRKETINDKSNTLKTSLSKAITNEESIENQVKKILDSQSGVCEDLKNEIAQVLSKRSNGVWAARLPIEYKKYFAKELKIRDHGFTTVVELADAMPDIIRIERPTQTGDWLLYCIKHISLQDNNIDVPEPSEDESDIPKPKEDTQSHISKRVLQVDDGVGQGIYFQNTNMPDSGYLTLYVSHCVDPQNFWVIFTDEWPKLEALGTDISIFYNSSEGDKYSMPEWLVSVGQVCCAWCEDYGDWYRAVITGVTSMQSIEVFYVDYGNSGRVALSEIRVLRSAYLKISGQACHSQLSYIKPLKGTEWSPGCCHRFYHLTKNYKALYGLLCGTKDGKLCLCIIDTSSDDDVHINDILVDEGFSMFCPDSPVSPSTFPAKTFFRQTSFEKINEEKPKSNQPPGLPPARQGQQLFNQHIATSLASTAIPEFPFQVDPICNGGPPLNSFGEDNTSKQSSQPTDEDSVEDMAFIEEICSEMDQETEEEYILKRLSLMDMCAIHVINYYKVPYVTSADISVLLWDSDVLRAMLRQKKMAVPKLVLSNEEDSELIEQLVKHNVRGVMDGETSRSFVTLYPLTSLPYILRKFNHQLEELVSRVELEVQQFEKEKDDYWLVKEDVESVSTGTDSESRDEDISSHMEQLEIEELKLVIQALQFRRKRILQDLMSPSLSGTHNTVEELVEVENKIERLKHEVSRKNT